MPAAEASPGGRDPSSQGTGRRGRERWHGKDIGLAGREFFQQGHVQEVRGGDRRQRGQD